MSWQSWGVRKGQMAREVKSLGKEADKEREQFKGLKD